MIYLTKKQLILLHEQLLVETGGDPAFEMKASWNPLSMHLSRRSINRMFITPSNKKQRG